MDIRLSFFQRHRRDRGSDLSSTLRAYRPLTHGDFRYSSIKVAKRFRFDGWPVFLLYFLVFDRR